MKMRPTHLGNCVSAFARMLRMPAVRLALCAAAIGSLFLARPAMAQIVDAKDAVLRCTGGPLAAAASPTVAIVPRGAPCNTPTPLCSSAPLLPLGAVCGGGTGIVSAIAAGFVFCPPDVLPSVDPNDSTRLLVTAVLPDAAFDVCVDAVRVIGNNVLAPAAVGAVTLAGIEKDKEDVPDAGPDGGALPPPGRKRIDVLCQGLVTPATGTDVDVRIVPRGSACTAQPLCTSIVHFDQGNTCNNNVVPRFGTPTTGALNQACFSWNIATTVPTPGLLRMQTLPGNALPPPFDFCVNGVNLSQGAQVATVNGLTFRQTLKAKGTPAVPDWGIAALAALLVGCALLLVRHRSRDMVAT